MIMARDGMFLPRQLSNREANKGALDDVSDAQIINFTADHTSASSVVRHDDEHLPNQKSWVSAPTINFTADAQNSPSSVVRDERWPNQESWMSAPTINTANTQNSSFVHNPASNVGRHEDARSPSSVSANPDLFLSANSKHPSDQTTLLNARNQDFWQRCGGANDDHGARRHVSTPTIE